MEFIPQHACTPLSACENRVYPLTGKTLPCVTLSVTPLRHRTYNDLPQFRDAQFGPDDANLSLILELILQLQINLPRIPVMRPSECQAVIQQIPPVRQIQPRQSQREPLPQRLAQLRVERRMSL